MSDTIPLGEIRPDDKNANRHTERGTYMVRRSVEKFGWLEGGTLDKNNRVLHGNNRLDAAVEILDPKDVIVIDIDGKKPVYLRRKDLDLDTPEGREAAIALNRSAQVSIDFDPEVLADFDLSGVELDDWFTEWEQMDLEIIPPNFEPTDGSEQPRLDQIKPTICPECGHEFKA